MSFGKYLSFPIFNKHPVNSDFQYLVDNMRQKLTGWKLITLNMAGRMVLAKVSLSGIPSNVMSYVKLPEAITKTLKLLGTSSGVLTRNKENAPPQLGLSNQT